MTGATGRAVRRPAAPLAAPSPGDEISRLRATQAADSGGERPISGLLRQVAAHLANLSGLAEQLSEHVQNQLAAGPERALMSGVDQSNAPPSSKHPVAADLLTVRDIAQLLGVSPGTIRRWRREGKLPPAVEIGGVVRWRADAIGAWIADREERPR